MVLATDVNVRPPVVAPGTAPTYEQAIRLYGGNNTHIIEVDWDGNVVWQYANPALHHDFVRLENGNTLMPVWVELSPELAREVRGGYRERPAPPMLGDDILEVDHDGREVRRMSLWKLMDPGRDAICGLERRIEWTHLNGIDVMADGNVVFSCRSNSYVGIVERTGGKILWRYGFPDIAHQHHPTALANGNVLIFDNGMHRRGTPRSSVVEVSPSDSSVAWRYLAEPEQQFFSNYISGCERQPNGNTLVCEGAAGRIFEVTRRGEVVWEWINPFVFKWGAILTNRVFRAHRYSPDHPALAGRDLDPRRYADLNRLHGLDA
jgi:hypothetical protein